MQAAEWEQGRDVGLDSTIWDIKPNPQKSSVDAELWEVHEQPLPYSIVLTLCASHKTLPIFSQQTSDLP